MSLDIPYLLPMATYRRVTPSGKRRETHRALFPGYLFLAGDWFGHLDDPRRDVPGLLSTHPVADVPGLVADLARLCDLIDAGAPLSGATAPLRPGESVRIASGPFEGFTGRFVRDGGRDLLQIDVRIFNRAVEMNVESWRVERVG